MGKITAISLMGTDVERIVGGMQFFHEVWGSLLDIAIASWLLGRQLFLACIAPIVLVLGNSSPSTTKLLMITLSIIQSSLPLPQRCHCPVRPRSFDGSKRSRSDFEFHQLCWMKSRLSRCWD